MPVSTVSRHQDLFSSPEAKAERILLDLADYLYANTALKPMSKTLFAISRLMLVVRRRADGANLRDIRALTDAYEVARAQLPVPLVDDFVFQDIATLCQRALPRIMGDLGSVVRLVGDGDALGLLLNTLVRGKWDSGEGMGTFLTPEEVVDAIVAMVLTRNEALDSEECSLAGDICGGTGRFPFALARALRTRLGSDSVRGQIFSFDQSSLATDYACLNLHFLGLRAKCEVVSDSLVNEGVTRLKNQCSALATNPPFGAGKYRLSQALKREIPSSVLQILVGRTRGHTADPAGLFVFRNLDLLRIGGVLGIVLPDGVLRSHAFIHALKAYERERRVAIEVRAIVSLPTVTFAFGGTVAKTSFLIISKEDAPSEYPLFVGHARHIGYLKRGNKRVADLNGNDLSAVVRSYMQHLGNSSSRSLNWRRWTRLGLSPLATVQGATNEFPLSRYCTVARDFTHVPQRDDRHCHISVLDVDETGLIDVLSSRRNRPASRVLLCEPGDVLLSCINPRIWRVAVVPRLPGRWTCSAEFLVLRAREAVSPWEVALRLHHAGFKTVIQSMAGGTSSSRQRVDKEEILAVAVPRIKMATREIEAHAAAREEFYAKRLAEGLLYEALHDG